MSKSIEDALTAIVGAKGIAVETEDKAPFLKERRGLYEGSCLAVVSPASTEQVSEVVTYCFENDIPITPQSGNTGLCGGAVPRGGILLNLGRMNKVRNHAEARLRTHLMKRHKVKARRIGLGRFPHADLYGRYGLYKVSVGPGWRSAHASA